MAEQARATGEDDEFVVADPTFLAPDPVVRKRAIEAFADLIVDALTRDRP